MLRSGSLYGQLTKSVDYFDELGTPADCWKLGQGMCKGIAIWGLGGVSRANADAWSKRGCISLWEAGPAF